MSFCLFINDYSKWKVSIQLEEIKQPKWVGKLLLRRCYNIIRGGWNVMKYFEYVNLAKQEYQNLLKRYPELSQLSAREMEVFSHLLSDKTLSEIAMELYISYSSVHFHCKNIYKKLGISNRKQILIKYKELH